MNTRAYRLALIPLVFCLLILLPDTHVQAQSAGELFEKANELYQARQYIQAASAYEAVIQSGVRSASLYFNLGNSYFKQGKLGGAIANYLRAQRLEPRNPDIEWNLKYARSLQIDQEFTRSENAFTAQLFFRLRDELTLRELAFAALISFWCVCLSLAGCLWKDSYSWFRSAAWVFLVLYLVCGALAWAKYTEIQRPCGVVLTSEVTVTSGPDGGTALFTLHEGTTVSVQRLHGDWLQIRLPNGLSGWLERAHLELI